MDSPESAEAVHAEETDAVTKSTKAHKVAKARRSGPVRDTFGVAKFRHEAIACILRVDPTSGVTALSIKRTHEPFKGMWALPSGALEVSESLEQSVLRHLRTKTGLETVSHLEQLRTYSSPSRDPFDRTIATAYMGLVSWDTTCNDDSESLSSWVPADELTVMGFDHHAIVREACERLRAKLSYTNIAYAIAAEEFTIADLRHAYGHILGYDVAPTNLQRVLTRRGQLKDTGRKTSPQRGGGRPARLFTFAAHELEITDPFATFKPSDGSAAAQEPS